MMRRCPHDVRIPTWHSGNDSPYCSGCNSSRVIPNQKDGIQLPRSCGDPLEETGRVYANKHNGIGCPECGSHVWCRAKESGSDAQRICADCGHRYSVRSRRLAVGE